MTFPKFRRPGGHTTSRKLQPRLESLEDRDLKAVGAVLDASGMLSIIGHSSASNSVSVNYSFWSPNFLEVHDNSSYAPSPTRTFPAWGIKLIRFEGGAKSDTFENLTRISCRANGYGDTDYLYGGSGPDLLNGGAGIDWVVGRAGNDTLLGGDDNDFLFGAEGDDDLDGGSGDDELNGGDGKDWLKGQGGNDRLFGNGGEDWLDGGIGFDYLDGGHDYIRDHLNGNQDDDMFVQHFQWTWFGRWVPEEEFEDFGQDHVTNVFWYA